MVFTDEIGRRDDIISSRRSVNLDCRHLNLLLLPSEAGLSSAKRTTEALFRRDISALALLSESEIDDVFEGAAKCRLFFDVEQMTALDLAVKANCFESQCTFPLMHSIDKAMGFAKHSIIACL